MEMTVKTKNDMNDVPDSDDENIVTAECLSKEFGNFTAVRSIDLRVKEGNIYGLLGPNGAGKTTTIRMLTTLLTPTTGKITIAGCKLPAEIAEARRSIGVVQQQMSLDRDLTVADNIFQHGIQHRMSFKEVRERSKTVAESLGLMPFYKKKVDDLSGGWKRKTAIACSLVHRPRILFLDEPTAGLDTQSRYMLWDLVRYLRDTSTTIFITTHYIEEAENLCDRVAIMNKGKVVAEGAPAELCNQLGEFTVEYNGNDHKRIYRYFRDKQSAKIFSDTLTDALSVSVRPTCLEDFFLEKTGRIEFKAGNGDDTI